MTWVTRERPVVHRIACPWLIKRFVDPAAESRVYDALHAHCQQSGGR